MPPSYFRAKLLYRVVLPPLHAPPPRGPLEPVCGTTVHRLARVHVLQTCINRVENSCLGLFHWSWMGRHPAVVAGGRSLATRLLYKKWQHGRGEHPSVLPRHVDRRSSRLPPHNRASLISVREFVGGGGLNCKAKAQVLVVTPSPLFFLEVGRKKGGA